MAVSALYRPTDSWRVRIIKYLRNNLVSFDQTFNTLLGGYPDETLSSRAGKARRANKRWACVLCKTLDLFDPGHCEKAIEADEGDPAPPQKG